MNPISAQSLLFRDPSKLADMVAKQTTGPNAPKLGADEIDQLRSSFPIPQTMPSAGGTDSFGSVLGQMVSEVNAKQFEASRAVGGLLSGQGVPLHQAVIASEEASISFQLMVEVRNKLLDSYQELMRMQI